MELRCIMVVGAGQMGSGIARVAAQSGFEVLLQDLRPDLIDGALAEVALKLENSVAKKMMQPQDRSRILHRIRPTLRLEEAERAQCVIEAATEDLAVKQEIFRTLDAATEPKVILATNTSSLPVTEIASATRHPQRVIGMHFMNPVHRMPLVEVVRGLATSDLCRRQTLELAQSLGKTPVEVQDGPGFVSNRLLMPMINEAVFCLQEAVASAEAIDTVMRLGMNHPMGPLALADLIGLDTCLAILESLHAGFADSKYRPCPLLRRMVMAGRLGKKSGRGFFEYP